VRELGFHYNRKTSPKAAQFFQGLVEGAVKVGHNPYKKLVGKR
jgi:hypothetical protein